MAKYKLMKDVNGDIWFYKQGVFERIQFHLKNSDLTEVVNFGTISLTATGEDLLKIKGTQTEDNSFRR